jgi:hypothetical protein
MRLGDWANGRKNKSSPVRPATLARPLFGFFMRRMLTAKTTEFLELQPIRRFLLIFRRGVIAIFAIAAL